MKRTSKLSINQPKDFVNANPEAYKPVDLTEAYMLLCMNAVPQPSLYKSIDTALICSLNELLEQIEADGIDHVRIKIGEHEGKMREVLYDDYEFKRISGFYLILRRAIKGDVSTTDERVLKQHGLNSREELIQVVPELYNPGKDPRLKFDRYVTARQVLKEIIQANN